MEKEGSTSPLVGGVTWGLRPPLPQPYHGSTPTAHAIVIIPLWQATPQPGTDLPLG
jgi:hypothetical protein